MAITERTWRVGELARETGLTVRALHHYEAKGLLAPSTRTDAGYRLYSAEDVRHLYRILALRQLGIPLQQISEVLEGQSDLRALLQMQMAQVKRQVQLYRTLRWKLAVLMQSLDEGGIPTEQFIDTMEAITRMSNYFTPEQQADIARRAEALGPDGMKQAEQDWADLLADVRAEQAAGTAPADPRVAPLMARWRTLIAAFTGGDLATARALAQRYREEGFESPSRGMLDAGLMEYVGEAMAAHPG